LSRADRLHWPSTAKNIWLSFALAALLLLGYPFVLVASLFCVAAVASFSAPLTREIIAVALGCATQLLALAYPIVLAVSFSPRAPSSERVAKPRRFD
jgi:hypothetical protein